MMADSSASKRAVCELRSANSSFLRSEPPLYSDIFALKLYRSLKYQLKIIMFTDLL